MAINVTATYSWLNGYRDFPNQPLSGCGEWAGVDLGMVQCGSQPTKGPQINWTVIDNGDGTTLVDATCDYGWSLSIGNCPFIANSIQRGVIGSGAARRAILNLTDCTTSAAPPPVEIIPSPPPTGGGGGIQPPPTTGFPPYPSSINPTDWIKWLGQIFQWMLTNLWNGIAPALTPLIDYLWAQLPKPITDWLTGWKDFFVGVKEFFITPGVFHRKQAAAFYESGSDSAADTVINSNQTIMTARMKEFQQGGTVTADFGKQIQDAITSGMVDIQNNFDAPINPDDAIKVAQTTSDQAVTTLSALMILNLVAEMIPAINVTGLAFLSTGLADAYGLHGYITDYNDARWRNNVVRPMGYLLNEKYPTALSGLDQLISQRRKGLISNEVFTKDAVRSSGQSPESIHIDYKDSLAVPGLEDVLTYHFRHPDEPFDLGALQDLVGINYVDYKKYFDERQYGDISIRFLQGAADLLSLTEPQIRELLRLTRLSPVVNPVLGMSPLDIATKVVVARQKIYLEPKAVKPEKEKHFTYAQLIKFAEEGSLYDVFEVKQSAVTSGQIFTITEMVEKFITDELTAEGWDAEHILVLVDYIKKVIAAKAAKAASKTAAP